MKSKLTYLHKKCIIRLIAVIAFLILPVTELFAQEGGFTGSFSRMGFSPRGMAMGNAMTSVGREGNYGYYNPAHAAAFSEHVQVDFSSAALRFDRQLHMLSAGFQLPPTAGLSISLLNARVSDIDGRTQSGYHTENLSTSEYQLIGNFALRFSDHVRAGIGIKYNLANYHESVPKSSGIGLDLGILIKPADRINIGVTVQDLIAQSDINTSDLYGTDLSSNSTRNYPVRLITGISFEKSEDLLFSLDYETRWQTSIQNRMTETEAGVRTEREEISTSSRFIRFGSSYSIHERFTLRGGVQIFDIAHENQVLPSAGFSINLPYDRFSPSVDYAFMREPSQISTMHVFALRLNI